MLHAYALYARIRLGWYARASGRALLRHWQWLLLAGLLVPGVPVLAVLAAPSGALLAVLGAGPWSVFGIAAVAGLGALWVLPQRRALRGGEFATYAATLPLSPWLRRAVDLTVLLLADALFIAAVVFAAVLGGVAYVPGLVATVIAVLAAQMLLLAMPARSRRLWRTSLPPALQVQVQILAGQPGATMTRFGLALLLAVAAAAIVMALHFDVRALPTIIVALAAVGLVLGGLYRLLRDAHAPMQVFLATLPLPPRYWLLRDIALVLALGCVPLLMLLVWFGLFDFAALGALVLLAPAYLALLALLRLPLAWGSRFGAMLAALIAAGWAGGAIAMVLH